MDDAAAGGRDSMSEDKLCYQTVELLESKGWIATLPNSSAPGDYGEKRAILHSTVANLLMGALAEECSSPSMPPITDKPWSFATSCNRLLRELGSDQGIAFNKEITLAPRKEEEVDATFLLARIPNLGLDSERFNPSILKRLLEARKDSEVIGRRKAFQDKVDEYLKQLRAVEAPEQGVLAKEFNRDLDMDLEMLKRELRRAGVEALTTKEGLVATLASFLGNGLTTVIGLVTGLGGYRKLRREKLNTHWSSWIFSASAGRITLW
jgi:hypothetical protein